MLSCEILEVWDLTAKKNRIVDSLITVSTLVIAFLVNLFLVAQFDTKTMTPMIFVLGVFIVSWQTQGYFWGITASLVSVLAVNWAFTFPYWAFDLISPECISSAVVMLIVSTMIPVIAGIAMEMGIDSTLSAIVPAYILIWILFGV